MSAAWSAGPCYNGRTGGDNTAAIAIYTIVSLVICVMLFGVIFWLTLR